MTKRDMNKNANKFISAFFLITVFLVSILALPRILDETRETKARHLRPPTVPSGEFINLSAFLRRNIAFFNFKFTPSPKSPLSYKIKISNDVRMGSAPIFASGSRSPIRVYSPERRSSIYKCGSFIFWQVILEKGGKTKASSVQTAFIDCGILF